MVVHDLILRLGGPTALGSKINAAPKAISMWSKRNAIPRKYHLAVWRLAISEGIDWAPPGAGGLTLIPASTPPPQPAPSVPDPKRAPKQSARASTPKPAKAAPKRRTKPPDPPPADPSRQEEAA
jgi:hypothetical protein